MGLVLSAAFKYLKAWSFKALVTLGPEKEKTPPSRRENHPWGSSFSHIPGFSRRFPHHPKPMRSDLARWDELPARAVDCAADGPIHNPRTDRPVSDIAAGGLLLTI